jgi:hypothetical protein
MHKIFAMSEVPYFSESWPLIFDFWLFYYILCWIPTQIRFRNRTGTEIVMRSGSNKAKSYDSCGSGFGSPTLEESLILNYFRHVKHFSGTRLRMLVQSTVHCSAQMRGSNPPGLFIHTFDRVRAPQSEWRNHRRGMRRAGTGWMSAKPEVEVILLTYNCIFFWRCSADFAGISLVQKELDFLGGSAGN